MSKTVTEEDIKQEIFDYANKKYGKKLKEFYDKFDDYPDQGLDDEPLFKDFMDWLMLEKPLPDTGKTIAEEYAEEQSEQLSASLKEKISQMRQVIRSEFKILSKNGLDMKFEDTVSKKVYDVKLYNGDRFFSKGRVFTGRIHPFGSFYRTAGISLAKQSPIELEFDMMMKMFNERQIAKAEEKVLMPNSKVSVIINKYPIQWVDGVCIHLGINKKLRKDQKAKEVANKLRSSLPEVVKKLPEESKEALKLVSDKGGVVKYGMLEDYDDDITFWWSEHPPSSTIGLLRLNGLLAVGKAPMGNRLYKSAIIPSDIREELKELLQKE